MKPKFTPGPWTLTKNGEVLCGEAVPIPRIEIAEVFDEVGHSYFVASNAVPGDSHYDAHLIAAAPDLYEALENVRNLISEGAEHGFNYNEGDWADRLFKSQAKSSAALRKARGEE